VRDIQLSSGFLLSWTLEPLRCPTASFYVEFPTHLVTPRTFYRCSDFPCSFNTLAISSSVSSSTMRLLRTFFPRRAVGFSGLAPCHEVLIFSPPFHPLRASGSLSAPPNLAPFYRAARFAAFLFFTALFGFSRLALPFRAHREGACLLMVRT